MSIKKSWLAPALLATAAAGSIAFAPMALAENTGPTCTTLSSSSTQCQTPGNSQITDFAPDNALLSTHGIVHPVPEPATWLTMLLGFGLVGGALRFRRNRSTNAIMQIA